MKKFEYIQFNLPQLISSKRLERVVIEAKGKPDLETYPFKNVDSEMLSSSILNDYGSKGWEIIPTSGLIYFGKREIEEGTKKK